MKFQIMMLLAMMGVISATDNHQTGTTYGHKSRPYQYQYSVKDQYSGTKYQQDESSDTDAVHGSYSVLLPDGRTQHVRYQADRLRDGGYTAQVTYEQPQKYKSAGVEKYQQIEEYKPTPAPRYQQPKEYNPAPVTRYQPQEEYKPAPVPRYQQQEEYKPVPVPRYQQPKEYNPAPVTRYRQQEEYKPAPVPSYQQQEEYKTAAVPRYQPDYTARQLTPYRPAPVYKPAPEYKATTLFRPEPVDAKYQ